MALVEQRPAGQGRDDGPEVEQVRGPASGRGERAAYGRGVGAATAGAGRATARGVGTAGAV